MKNKATIAIISTAFCSSSSEADGSIKALRRNASFGFQSHRGLFDNACISDNQALREDTELSNTLGKIQQDFDTDFENNLGRYCKTDKNDIATFMDCQVDYQQLKFHSDYTSRCKSLQGKHYPVSLLMSCSGIAASNNLEIEMELLNVPSCFGRTCRTGEVYEGIIDVLKATEHSIAGAVENLSCKFYHDYDILKGADTIRVVDPMLTGSEIQPQYASRAARKSTVAAAFTTGLVAFFMF